MGCHFLLQTFLTQGGLTQGLNLGLPHCRQTLPSEEPGKINGHSVLELHEQWYGFRELQSLFMEQFIEGKRRELVLKMSSGEMEKNSGN